VTTSHQFLYGTSHQQEIAFNDAVKGAAIFRCSFLKARQALKKGFGLFWP
jgi:hypothetical protein